MFYHLVPRNSWYSFYRPRKDERLSQPWSHPVVLNTGLLDWQSSALTTRPLLHKRKKTKYKRTKYFEIKNFHNQGLYISFKSIYIKPNNIEIHKTWHFMQDVRMIPFLQNLHLLLLSQKTGQCLVLSVLPKLLGVGVVAHLPGPSE